MNNKLTPLLSVSITNFKTSNNTSRSGFFLLEATLSLLLCIALSGVLIQYKSFMIQLHSEQRALLKNLYTAELSAVSASTNTEGKTLAMAHEGTIRLYVNHTAPSRNPSTIFGFSR